VLTPSGKLEHAEGEAKLEAARESLHSAVVTIEKARSRLRRSDPAAAISSWKGLVASRWSLIDEFETGGKRYVVAQRNDVRLQGLSALTDREIQAVAQAALGNNNKLIAYALGVTASTVSVLLHRAARKLGTTTRRELIAAYERLSRSIPSL
jgi:DNA-binding CsgD family transcriptional regulator